MPFSLASSFISFHFMFQYTWRRVHLNLVLSAEFNRIFSKDKKESFGVQTTKEGDWFWLILRTFININSTRQTLFFAIFKFRYFEIFSVAKTPNYHEPDLISLYLWKYHQHSLPFSVFWQFISKTFVNKCVIIAMKLETTRLVMSEFMYKYTCAIPHNTKYVCIWGH